MGRAFEFRKARKMKRWSAMSKAFTRIGKDIVMAVKEGGPNPDANSRLRAVIQNAKAVNMPKDNVERAIKKATEKGQGDFKEVLSRISEQNPYSPLASEYGKKDPTSVKVRDTVKKVRKKVGGPMNE